MMLVSGMAACSSLPGFEQPVVTVSSIPLDEGGSFVLRLRVDNPNGFDLRLDGVTRTVDLTGRRVLSAVGNNLPVILAYGEEVIALTGSPSLLNAMRVIMDLALSGSGRVAHDLNLRLDPAGLLPTVTAGDRGNLDLRTVL